MEVPVTSVREIFLEKYEVCVYTVCVLDFVAKWNTDGQAVRWTAPLLTWPPIRRAA